MAENSKISWTDHTANFWWGCVRVGPLCDNCYAADLDKRYGGDHWDGSSRRRFIKSVWKDIEKWQKECEATNTRKRVFAMSMGDIFEHLNWSHPDAIQMDAVRKQALKVMEDNNRLDWLVLTKRISNVKRMVPQSWLQSQWPTNIRIGISVGSQVEADRDIPKLIELDNLSSTIVPNFLSMEPLLEEVSICKFFPEIDWVITGGESGPHARVANPDWFRLLRDECIIEEVPFHFKQWGEYNQDMVRVGKKEAGHLLDGQEWLQFP